METSHFAKIEKIYPIKDQNYILVQIKDDKWNIHDKKQCKINIKNNVVSFQYIGFANVNGSVMLKLIATERSRYSFHNICKLLSNQDEGLYLELTDRPMTPDEEVRQ